MTLDLDELERLHKAATPGPWLRLHDGERPRDLQLHGMPPVKVTQQCDCGQVWSVAVDWPVAYCDTRAFDEGPSAKVLMDNAAYIVAACNAVPEMIARIRMMPLPDYVGFDVNGKIVFEYEPSEENKTMARRVAEAMMEREIDA